LGEEVNLGKEWVQGGKASGGRWGRGFGLAEELSVSMKEVLENKERGGQREQGVFFAVPYTS